MTPSRAALAPAPASENLLASILFDPTRLNALQSFAEIMAKGVVAVPTHLRGKPADFLAIVLQAMRWRMDPYAVAQKTYLDPNGRLSYESQLINAVIIGSGALSGRPEYEWLGDWDRILGRVQERTGQNGGKFYVAAWDKQDETGLGVIVRGTLRGESEPRSVKVMMSQAYPRFSTQWATDPIQQLSYLALRKFARRYVPDAILGVHTAEDWTMEVDSGDEFEVLDAKRGPQRKSDRPVPMVDEVAPAKPTPQQTQTVDQATGEIYPSPTAAAAAAAPAAPATAEQGPINPITSNQVTYLRKKLQTSGIAEEDVCRRYHVASIELLSVEQFDELKSELLQNA